MTPLSSILSVNKDAILTSVYISWILATYLSTAVDTLRDLASSGKTVDETKAATWHGRFQVPKQWFLHFYVIGIVSSLLVLSFSDNWKIECVAPMLLQVVRRCYECCFVHVWKAESKMHLPAYVVGLLHYVILPFNFIGTNGDDNDVLRLVGILLCVYAQYEQDAHHCILAQLRHSSSNQTQRYHLPHGRWFQYIGSPQNLAEILIYLSFVMMLQSLPALALFLWVTSNQVVTAVRTHEWYMRHFDEYKKQQRRALIPFVF